MRAFFMSMDGRYAARSQGWRCGACLWMDGMQQGARDGGAAHAHGSTDNSEKASISLLYNLFH